MLQRFSYDLRKYLETNPVCTLRFTGSKTERRYVTTDGKKMLVWVILPQI
jgi:hypothetical protein